MRAVPFVLTVLILVSLSSPVAAQSLQTCRTDRVLTPAEDQRRLEGLTAVQLIADVLNVASTPLPGASRQRRFPTWEELSDSPAVDRLVATGKLKRDVAMRMQWGVSEPLPGWDVRLVAGRDSGYALSLRDRRDPCGFGYLSDETGFIAETRPVRSDRGQIVPLGTN
jgi:hypothetical protein